MNLSSCGPDFGADGPTARNSHLVARAVVNELHQRADVFDSLPDLRGVQITVKFDPATGTVRGVWSSIETGGYRRGNNP
jgi:hypothetical protein